MPTIRAVPLSRDTKTRLGWWRGRMLQSHLCRWYLLSPLRTPIVEISQVSMAHRIFRGSTYWRDRCSDSVPCTVRATVLREPFLGASTACIRQLTGRHRWWGPVDTIVAIAAKLFCLGALFGASNVDRCKHGMSRRDQASKGARRHPWLVRSQSVASESTAFFPVTPDEAAHHDSHFCRIA